MNNDSLLSEQIKQQHATGTTKLETFRTHGVSEKIAKDYLDTPDGTKYWLRLREADPSGLPPIIRTVELSNTL